MADCSKTEVFLAEWRRMHYSFYSCKGCPIYDEYKQSCLECITTNAKKSVEAVQKWSDKHPEKTPVEQLFEAMFTVD